jgi:hypothetical protein
MEDQHVNRVELTLRVEIDDNLKAVLMEYLRLKFGGKP